MTNCIFDEEWWLDAVAPESWKAVTVERDGHAIARLPFVARRRYGLNLLTQPLLTQTLGPWVRNGEGKYASRLSDQHELLKELIDLLPNCDVFAQTMAPSVSDFLPFHWGGFRTSVRCTYRLEDLRDLDVVWGGFTEKCRNTVRKAKKVVTVQQSEDLDRFFTVLAKTWTRQGLRIPYARDLLNRLHAVCRARGAARIFEAVDAQGSVHAAVFLVWDQRAAYYLLGGGDPDLRASGAHSLLMWEAIQFASTVTRVFDFEGSMNQSIEHFCRSFGAQQTPLVRVVRLSRRMAALTAAKELADVICGRPLPWFF
jgi:Acetyltransferase (GNAT) domain